MPDRVRVIRHRPKSIPDSGSFEVRIDGVAFKYIYWDDNKGRRSIRQGEILDQETAREEAKRIAREEREKLK